MRLWPKWLIPVKTEKKRTHSETTKFWMFLHEYFETLEDRIFVYSESAEIDHLEEVERSEILLYLEKAQYAHSSLRDAVKIAAEQIREKRQKGLINVTKAE